MVGFFLGIVFGTFWDAVGALVVWTAFSLVVAWSFERRFAWLPFITALSIIGFGGATLIFEDPYFVITRDSLYYGSLGAAILIPALRGHFILKGMFESVFAITNRGWRIVSIRWGTFFLAVAVLNECVRYASLEVWGMFKLATTVAVIIFAAWQFLLARAERLPTATRWGLRAVSLHR